MEMFLDVDTYSLTVQWFQHALTFFGHSGAAQQAVNTYSVVNLRAKNCTNLHIHPAFNLSCVCISSGECFSTGLLL